MFDFVSKSPLYDEAGEGSGAGAGTGEKNSGTFDPAAFETKLMGEFDKKLNGALKGFKTDFTKIVKDLKEHTGGSEEQRKAEEQRKTEEEQRHKEGEGKGGDPEKNALLLELKKERDNNRASIQALEKKNEEAEKRAEESEHRSNIRSLLAKHQFASEKAAETAFTIYAAKIQKDNETGQLVADDLPAAKFLEVDLAANHPYLLAPKDVGGSGARKGDKSGSNKKYNMDRNSADYALRPEKFKTFTAAEQAEIRQLVATS